METGEWKALVGYRSVLVAGPPDEVATVRRVFQMFVVWGLSMQSISNQLNDEAIEAEPGRPWTAWRVRQVLRNESYVGTLVLGKRAVYLKRSVSQPRHLWRRATGACPILVNPKLFDLAQQNIREQRRGGSDEDLLSELRDVLARRGRLSHGIIAGDPATRSVGAYIHRFGSLERAYELVGYARSARQEKAAARIRQFEPHRARIYTKPLSDEVLIQKLRALFREKGRLNIDIINAAPGMPCDYTYRRRFGGLGRAYAMVGYVPSKMQARRIKVRE